MLAIIVYHFASSCHAHASSCCICLLLIVVIPFGRLRSPGFHRISVWRILSLLWATRQATILIIPINPMFLLLHLLTALGSNASNAFATLVEPTSFAWPILVTVNSWTLQPSIPGSCLSHDVPYPAMHAMLRVVYGLSSGRWTEMWNVFGEQRLCVELDLVKVPVKGCVGVHSGLFHWNRP